jgi:hypothetical protein
LGNRTAIAMDQNKPILNGAAYVAYHEAGHVVLNMAFGIPPSRVWVKPGRDRSCGCTETRPCGNDAIQLQLQLAGLAATHLKTKKVPDELASAFEGPAQFEDFCKRDTDMRAPLAVIARLEPNREQCCRP